MSILIRDLGYRPPGLGELARSLSNPGRNVRARPVSGPALPVPAALLAANPAVSYSGKMQNAPLGVASLIGMRLAHRQAWFLLSPTWTIEDLDEAQMLRRAAVAHRFFNPRHRIVFMCNTEAEAVLMRSVGEAAILHVKTTNTCERTFRPLDVKREFDAVYNAQLAPFKRHELARAIPRCAFLYYRSRASTTESEQALIADHLRAAPDHVFINEFDADGVPVRLGARQVNENLNRASVGLCLSASEGAMFACAEYLLAGLPVVTTPNKGGRDFFLDDETCIQAADDPRAVAEAVAALKARNFPPDYVRQKTLDRMRPQRERLVGLVNDILTEGGSHEIFESPWPLKRPVFMAWMKAEEARRRIRNGIVDDLRWKGPGPKAQEKKNAEDEADGKSQEEREETQGEPL